MNTIKKHNELVKAELNPVLTLTREKANFPSTNMESNWSRMTNPLKYGRFSEQNRKKTNPECAKIHIWNSRHKLEIGIGKLCSRSHKISKNEI